MKKLLFLLLLFLVGCTKPTPEVTTNTYYNQMFSEAQVDSIIEAEQVDWIERMPVKGSDSVYYEYYYFRDSLVLRFIEKGDSIQVTKRINL